MSSSASVVGERVSDVAGWIAGPPDAPMLFGDRLAAKAHAKATDSEAEPVVRASLAKSLAHRVRLVTGVAAALERELAEERRTIAVVGSDGTQRGKLRELVAQAFPVMASYGTTGMATDETRVWLLEAQEALGAW